MNRFFLSLSRGTERALTLELQELGAKNIKESPSGIWCEHEDPNFYYVLALKSRIALHIYLPLYEFEISSQDDFYDEILKIDWDKHLSLDETFSITANCKSSVFTHNHYLALKMKDGICDHFFYRTKKRPDVDTKTPDKAFAITMNKNRCMVSIDVSGFSLHKRGYRLDSNLAPLMETVAASLIRLSEWDGEKPFYDLMCGSGTLGIEAGLYSSKRYLLQEKNDFSFLKWTQFSNDYYNQIVSKVVEETKENTTIYFNDISSKNVEVAKKNCRRAKLVNNIKFDVSSILDYKPETDSGLVILNPPYGERMGDETKIQKLYQALYEHLKQNFKGFRVSVISSKEEHLQELKFKPTKIYNIFNGNIKCRFALFDIY
jgi:23S rRNA G2445 N2-methylase RlmL